MKFEIWSFAHSNFNQHCMKHLYYCLFFVGCSNVLLAQTTTLQGRVLDAKTKEPLIGANIYLRDTYDGATSDSEGRYAFETEESGSIGSANMRSGWRKPKENGQAPENAFQRDQGRGGIYCLPEGYGGIHQCSQCQ